MKRRETNVFSIAFLDLLSGALGAVIILFVTVPKAKNPNPKLAEIKAKEGYARFIPKESIIDKQSDYTAKFNEKEEIKQKTVKLTKTIEQMKKKQEELESSKETMAETIKKLQEKIEKVQDRKVASVPVDVGFKFKGKNIVLVIDVSGSMFLEDKIGQVKAGLKMLITSMGDEFNIDVVHFPDGMTHDYRTLWGRTKKMSKRNKTSVYDFLQDLKPWGSTPTRSVMKYVLRNYKSATDIVLLSDGAPTKKNSKMIDNIDSVASDIKIKNNNRVQISTIGVGSDFLRNTRNPKYRFLKKVADENGGFFVGF
ncbi:MAG: VWA domain-containing protein [Bacteriovoracaceae bacterium]|jgi:Mg-chelatase subunit ChlD|nr:VWA domain-containing protein [Bacteriovoracaceae bacterium]